MKDNKKIKISTIFYAVVILVIIFNLALAGVIYKSGIKNNFTNFFVKLIPYPIASVNYTNWISFSTLEENLNSVRMFYENQDFTSEGYRIDFKTSDGQKRLKIKEKNLLNKLIENKIIEILAQKKGIVLTDALVSQEVERKLTEYGSRDTVESDLKRLYGWDIEKFKDRIVKPDMYRSALEDNVRNSDENFAKAKTKIQEAKAELDKGKNFEEVVKNFSEGESVKNNGDLGWFTIDQMLPEIAVVAFPMEKGKTSDIIESSVGFHIIKLEDKKTEGDVQKVRISQIFVKTQGFSEWLFEQSKQFKINIFKDYYWDQENQKVNFRDQSLTDFENNLEKNSPDDISVIF